MRRFPLFLGLGSVLAATAAFTTPAAHADNSPTFRDCSLFVSGVDEDFVQISGVSVTPQGSLTVPATQKSVVVEASESPDPGDDMGHVTLSVTTTSGHLHPATVSGAALDKVFLTVPLPATRPGRSYTLNWSATFDNGGHLCPSPNTPANTQPNPFVVTAT